MTSVRPLPDPASLRTLAAGRIIGSLEAGAVHAWRGLPYAAPPVGPLRWRAPQPLAPWEHLREALAHGPIAPQYADLLAGTPPRLKGQVVGSEDCLSLNVFAPAFAPEAVPGEGARRPVMVWIHGGANAVGTSATYDVAANHARRHGLIVVTVNYRLGVFGWFNHPALAAADDATPEERSGNFGTLDLIAALRWVQANIAAFGGDPACVTVFGESAGALNVLTLLASPAAAGLFHRAIAQSPVALTFSVAQATNRLDDADAGDAYSGQEVAAALWVADGRASDRAGALETLGALPARDVADFLRSLSPAALMSAYEKGSFGFYLGPRPVRDGVVLPLAPLPEVFAGPHWNRVPVILGTNRDECRTFLCDKPEYARVFFGAVPVLRDRRIYALESEYYSAAWQAWHLDAIADAMLAGGHDEVWTYRFDWDEAPALPLIRPDLLLGAAHGMEMPFAFGDEAGEFDPFKVNTPFNRAGRQALARDMAQAWANLARAGRPGEPSGVWKARRRDPGLSSSLLLDSPAGGGLRMAATRLTMDGLKASLRSDPRFRSGVERCRVYARVFLWNPLFAGYGDAAEYSRWCEEFSCAVPAEQFKPKVSV